MAVNAKRPQQPNQPLTIMIVPRSGKVLSFSIGTLTVRKIAMILAFCMLLAGAYTVRYNILSKQVVELSDVKKVNEIQKGQIDEITTDLDAVKQDLQRVKDLERKVRELLGGEREVLNLRLAARVETVLEASEARQALSPVVSRSLPRLARNTASIIDLPLTIDTNRSGQRAETVPGDGGQGLDTLSGDLKAARAELLQAESDLARTVERLEGIIKEAKAMPSYFPVAGGKITSTFGGRKSPFGSYTQFHEGIDIAAPYGTAVQASGSGVVTFTGYKSGLGLTVVIDHGNGVTTTYGHLSRVSTTKGAKVERGTRVGSVGTTGRVTGPHLHYELRKNGKLQDPLPHLSRTT